MNLRQYPAYRDSGVEWLGEVPKSWGLCRLGTRFFERREKVSDADYPPLSVTKNGIVPQLDTAAKTDDGDNRKKVCCGDFVINSRSDRKGSSGLASQEGSVSLINIVLEPLKVEPDFISFLLKSVPFQEEFYRNGKGIVADLWSTHFSEMKDILLPLPSVEEQAAIATYLDRETAKIDELVIEKERLIELLKEKRQALISHAVTKGLDPNVPMKDSGVEWLGEVPRHWQVKKFKQIVSIPITDGPHETPEFIEQGVPFVSAEAVSSGYIDFQKIRGFISREDHARYSLKYLPQLNDIFMVKSGATTGITALVVEDVEFNIWSPLAVIRCGREVVPLFVLSFMRSRHFLEAIKLSWNFGTQQNIGMGVLEELFCVQPPIAEQQAIATYLDRETAKIDSLIADCSKAIDLLKEKRSVLISAVVTGKVDVRHLVEAI
ncbi:MAG: restriction endonuclease subunit S [Verrucomicrobia bacterium]|nr:restriction endonuclease subunit S [Verrucomicrobiota bacterium]